MKVLFCMSNYPAFSSQWRKKNIIFLFFYPNIEIAREKKKGFVNCKFWYQQNSNNNNNNSYGKKIKYFLLKNRT